MKNINLTNTNDLMHLKESLNKTIDSKIKMAQLNEIANSLDDMGFSEIHTVFGCICESMFNTDKRLIGDYVKILKENKGVRTMYDLYNSVMNPINVSNTDLYLESISKLSDSLDKKELNGGLSALREVLKEGLKKTDITADEIKVEIDKKSNINESFNFITTKKLSSKCLNEYVEHKNNLLSYINENKISREEEKQENHDTLLSNLRESINNPELEQWEREAISDLSLTFISESSKEELYNKYKNDCINLINEKIENAETVEESARFNAMKAKLEEKQFNEETIRESIFTLSELKHTLSD